MNQDDVAGPGRGRSGGGTPLDKSVCRSRGHHAHKCTSIHWMHRLKIVLAVHGSSPLRKVRVGNRAVLRLLPLFIEQQRCCPATFSRRRFLPFIRLASKKCKSGTRDKERKRSRCGAPEFRPTPVLSRR